MRAAQARLAAAAAKLASDQGDADAGAQRTVDAGDERGDGDDDRGDGQGPTDEVADDLGLGRRARVGGEQVGGGGGVMRRRPCVRRPARRPEVGGGLGAALGGRGRRAHGPVASWVRISAS